ncbi:hypothetical protein TH53_24625 [Pedobacter lusitanus]|uniref:Uncharacterized protein n=2 Tax=Pedobacter lusitanus TaxID=1503925 RepID=A0A0D0GBV0_9SPHI|nr:hypothetical protein [Pedobacter lusitanus]KIO74752.1 hypothetical protein TH53_24625 [Pedobacter lusitanus]
MDDLDLDDLKFQKNGLLLTRKSCSGSHYFQALEDADIYSNLLNNKYLQPYLNAYGNCLLSAKNEKCIPFQSTGLNKNIYKGKINDLYPITLLITRVEKNSFQAAYFYDQQGKKIFLNGTFNKDLSLLLNGGPSTGTTNNKELFKLKMQADGSLTGTWSNGKSSYPLVLKGIL